MPSDALESRTDESLQALRGTPAPPNPFQVAAQQRVRILRFVRGGFLVLITTVAALLTIQAQQAARGGGGSDDTSFAQQWYVPIAVAIFLFCVALLIDLFTPNKKLSTISAIFFGTLGGMLATAAVAAVIDVLVAAWVPNTQPIAAPLMMFKVMLGMALCYLGVSSVLQTQDDFRLVIPYVEFARQTRGVKPNILDTSALIDARIAEICATGLIQTPIVIPRFVIAELQLLADSHDKLKRARGRRGLDVVTRLQRLGTLDVSIDDSRVTATAMSVDLMLVELAKQLSGRVVTTDLALARIAQIHGVTALNLHEIANAFKPALIPGEQLSLRLVKPGEQPAQGVGYLEDGTMVVVDGGAPYIGTQVDLLVTGSMQTTAGRLVFARVFDTPQPSAAISAPAAPQPQAPPLPAAIDDQPVNEPEAVAPPADAGNLAAPRRSPFPPKPPARRDPNSARNPRR